MSLPIYLDYNATTPVDERVVEQMLPYLTEHFGNASSAGHAYGWRAEEAVEVAREEVAALLGGSDPEEVVFTSGATEALNMAIRGVFEAYGRVGRHVVTVATEHKAVLETVRGLTHRDAEVTVLPVDEEGRVTPEEVAEALREETILVAVMAANNETGVLQDVAAIHERVREHGALMLVDATQAAGKMPIEARWGDLIACSAHKFYGPKGVGALYVSRRDPRVRLVPLVEGGGQERGRRGGTQNVPGIVGMGEAARLARAEWEQDAARLGPLRDRLEEQVCARLEGVRVNGAGASRLPQTSNLTFAEAPADRLLRDLRGVACSTGSACSSGSKKPSHVLTAMDRSAEEARSTLRLSLGRFTTGEEVDRAVEQVVDAVESVRSALASS